MSTATESGLSVKEARAIAKEAYTYGFPMAANYNTMYKQAIDEAGSDYRGAFNTVHSSKSVATPEDKFVVTPNSDTPYSYLWLDLRAEPIVVTMPKIEGGRYYTGQLVDLYTFNFAYLGTRAYGNDGGEFLIAGPGWSGATPAGIKAVLRSETQFAYVLFRTQLFNMDDLPRVNEIQSGYKARPLSAFPGQAAAPAAPAIDWPKPADIAKPSADVFRIVDFLFQFCPPNPVEKDLLTRFAEIHVGPKQTFGWSGLSEEMQQAINGGIEDANREVDGVVKQLAVNPKMNSSGFFGTRESLKGNYQYRFVGARLGLYGNSAGDAIYFGIFADGENKPLDASKANYTFTFAKEQVPPAKAFWSLTMYDGKSQLLVENSLKRYLLNSTTLKSYGYGADGSLTFYISHDDPGAGKTANWLPAPDGPFYVVLRIYMPEESVANGTWQKPQMVPVAK